MSYNLYSSKVIVYPSTNRNTQGSRLLTENRITTLIKNINDTDAWVDGILADTGSKLYISMMGYYFCCELTPSDGTMYPSDVSIDHQVLYAFINIMSGGEADGLYDVLDGADVTNNYTGISFEWLTVTSPDTWVIPTGYSDNGRGILFKNITDGVSYAIPVLEWNLDASLTDFECLSLVSSNRTRSIDCGTI